MKLRSRIIRSPPSSCPSVTATLPVLPPHITRLQTPPISELSNAGSTIANKERLSELSSSIIDRSDTEEAIYSVTPTKSGRKPIIAAPLTTTNLAMHQEELTSAVENEDGRLSPPLTSDTQLSQVRNYLLTEDINSDPKFKIRYLHIAEYLHNHRQMKGREEVLQLLEQHSPYAAASKEATSPQSPSTVKDSSKSNAPLLAEDDQDPQEKIDPFKWTNKLGDLTERVRQTPSGGKEAFAVANLQEMARPLNGGRLPSPVHAYQLIDEQMTNEFRKDERSNDADSEDLWARDENDPSSASSVDQPQEEEAKAPAFKLGQGKFMPQEMMDVDWDRDRSKLEESLVGCEDVDGGEAQLLFAETPLLQALMSEQIESDLAAKVKNGQTCESVERRPVMLMTQKFALPRPSQSRINESAKIARSLNIQNDPHPHTPSPTTALFLKRKFEQESDDESEDDEDYEDEVEDEEEVEEEYEEDEEDESEIRGKSEPPAIGGAKGKHVYVDETVLARDGLIDGSFGGGMMMSGALQDPEVA